MSVLPCLSASISPYALVQALPEGSQLGLITVGAFLVCLAVLQSTSRREHRGRYDELEDEGRVNGVRLRRTAARTMQGRARGLY